MDLLERVAETFCYGVRVGGEVEALKFLFRIIRVLQAYAPVQSITQYTAFFSLGLSVSFAVHDAAWRSVFSCSADKLLLASNSVKADLLSSCRQEDTSEATNCNRSAWSSVISGGAK